MITVVLPAYNEEKTIILLLTEIRRLLKERFGKAKIIIVDDGSTDGTSDMVKEFRDLDTKLIKHITNQGLGEAVKTGLLEAVRISSDSDVIVTMDADNSHCPGLLFRMASLIDEGNDVIIASRYVKGARVLGFSRKRRLISAAGSLFLRTLFPTKGVRDFTSGYRVYRAAVLRKAFDNWGDAFINESGFTCIVDILLKLRKMNNVVINEVPLILHYDYKFSASKMDISKTMKRTFKLAIKRFFRR